MTKAIRVSNALTRRHVVAGAVGLALVTATKGWAGTITDAANVSVTVAAAKRIITIGSAITEIAFALGEKDHVVAVDLTSAGVKGAETLPNIGYMRALSTEGVLSQSPDLLCISSDSGPPEVLDALRASGVPFALVPHVPTIDGIKTKVSMMGALLDKVAEADKINTELDTAFAVLAKKISAVSNRPKVLFVLSLADNRIVAGGSDTAADTIINLAGGDNIAASFKGYKPMSAEAILATPPDAILMMEGGAMNHKTEDVLAQAAFQGSPAARTGNIITMNGPHLLGFGPHTAEAATELARKLLPDLKL